MLFEDSYHYTGSAEDASSNSGSVDNSYSSEMVPFDVDGNVNSIDSPSVRRRRENQQMGNVITELASIRSQLQVCNIVVQMVAGQRSSRDGFGLVENWLLKIRKKFWTQHMSNSYGFRHLVNHEVRRIPTWSKQ